MNDVISSSSEVRLWYGFRAFLGMICDYYAYVVANPLVLLFVIIAVVIGSYLTVKLIKKGANKGFLLFVPTLLFTFIIFLFGILFPILMRTFFGARVSNGCAHGLEYADYAPYIYSSSYWTLGLTALCAVFYFAFRFLKKKR